MRVTIWADDMAMDVDPSVVPNKALRERMLEVPAEREVYFAACDEWRETYPNGLNQAIGAGLKEYLGERVAVRTARFDDPEHGIGDEVLEETDVLIWWGHLAHEEVDDRVVERVWRRVLAGMGLIVLHSAHDSKIFRRLMGTTCHLSWRVETDERELIWTISPAHPIASSVPHPIVIPRSEMHCEHFDIPAPDELVFISSYGGGEVSRSGCCYFRGAGRVFYFGPGHETFPIFFQPEVRQVMANAVTWAFNEHPSSIVLDGNHYRPSGWFEA